MIRIKEQELIATLGWRFISPQYRSDRACYQICESPMALKKKRKTSFTESKKKGSVILLVTEALSQMLHLHYRKDSLCKALFCFCLSNLKLNHLDWSLYGTKWIRRVLYVVIINQDILYALCLLLLYSDLWELHRLNESYLTYWYHWSVVSLLTKSLSIWNCRVTMKPLQKFTFILHKWTNAAYVYKPGHVAEACGTLQNINNNAWYRC